MSLFAEELDAHKANLLLGVVATQLLHSLFEAVALGVLLEVEVDILGLVLVNHLVYVVADVEFRARIDNRLNLAQQFAKFEVLSLGNILEVHLAVDALDDEYLVGALIHHALNHHILRADNILLLDIVFDKFNEWCSEFVAYTAYCLGFVKDGKMPKVNECWKAHDFYKAKGELHQKSGYYPKPGDVAYFGDKGLLHTSIVKSYDGKTLHTIDGNQYIDSQTWRTSIVKECSFNINDGYVWGFANPLTKGKTGWEYKDKKWYFYDNGVLVKGWKKIQWKQGTDWFWFDSNGVMATGWQKLKWSKGTSWFYFTQDGAMVTGLHYLKWQDKSDWYLFDTTGAMLTGKQKAEIVLNNSGQMTGGKKA